MSGSARPFGGGLETRVAEIERKMRSTVSPAGMISGLGTVTLAASPATSTVQTDANVTASSVILPVANNASGWSLDAGITGITPAAGQFTIAHSASTLTRSFQYVVINPA